MFLFALFFMEPALRIGGPWATFLLILSGLGERLESALAPDVALEKVVETVAQALKVPHSAIALRGEDGFVTAAEFGRR